MVTVSLCTLLRALVQISLSCWWVEYYVPLIVIRSFSLLPHVLTHYYTLYSIVFQQTISSFGNYATYPNVHIQNTLYRDLYMHTLIWVILQGHIQVYYLYRYSISKHITFNPLYHNGLIRRGSKSYSYLF